MPDRDREFTVRVYSPNGIYHSVVLGINLTVDDLLSALRRRTWMNDSGWLVLRERGKERTLNTHEVPFDIICRRMTEAGYSWNDGLILLNGEHMSFLLKFVCCDPDLSISHRPFTSGLHGHRSQDNEIHLETFDYVDFTGRSLRTIPIVLHQHADQIISLKLTRNPMIDLPLDFLEACTQIRDLRLSNMSMRRIPAGLAAAKQLRRLDLASNYIKLKRLEEGRLHRIPELMSLYLQNNLLKDLPTSFAEFEFLATLNVSNNQLKVIPDVVTKIATLNDLDVSFNALETLPLNIGDLHALERFLCVGNMISEVPNTFCRLKGLEYVDCRRNRIVDLTVVMNLPRLKSLFADHNAIHLLDLSVGLSLTTVDVSHNEITRVIVSLPPFDSASLCLTMLDLSNASLTILGPGVLDKLTTLRVLKLQHNTLSYIPDTLGELAQLEALYCYDNRLIKLPDTIGKLARLKLVDAHNNNLREIPTTIWHCSALTNLNLSSNFVVTFPVPTIIPIQGEPVSSVNGHTVEVPEEYNHDHVILGHLYPPLSFSLEYLFISENKLSDSEGLQNIAFLRALLAINLSYNEIDNLPTGFFRGMPKLREVYLCGNEMPTLPAEDLGRLRGLHTLYLSGNKLTVLPMELSRLNQLVVIDVSNNDLRYNVNNHEFDWNWNYNRSLRYLNLSGNRRLAIRPGGRPAGISWSSHERQHTMNSLSSFVNLRRLRNLGLMDITITGSNLPDENDNRRIRSTASIVGGLGYGISDCLGREHALTMLDLVHEFPGHPNRALFAMFGNIGPPKALPPGISPNRHAKYLHDHFLDFFQNQMDHSHMLEGKHMAVDALRRSFLGLHQAMHNQLFTVMTRKTSAGSANSAPMVNVDPVTARGGCSGLVVYIEGRKLFSANVGTALGVISRKGQPLLVSKKHDPWNPEELRRIRKSEGWISPSGLVNDEVDVSRSFGYYHMLPVIHASPDIYEYDISDVDEFLIMGNRGLWDYVDFQMAVDIASTRNDPALVAQQLRDVAMSYGSIGNIMVMVIRLKDVHDKSIPHRPTLLGSGLEFPPMTHTLRMNHPVTDKNIRRVKSEIAPPTGHVALVFTDIKNSAHLWEVNPGMPAAIQLHNELMRRQLRICGGYESKSQGHMFLCSFPTVMAAVWFCLSMQVHLLYEHWPKEFLECEDGQPIEDSSGNLIARGMSVHMGIHCGAPLCVQNPVTFRMDYLGPVINRAALVSGLARGGQILCSAEVIREIKALVLETVPKTEFSRSQPPKAIDGVKQLGVVIKDIGNQKLEGLEAPEFLSAIYPFGLEGRHNLGPGGPRLTN
ncbi:hypothetical protein P691DRAFT_667167 [Macrolepiota fuliginosa MF-IS2]|uniref:PPM-type phosphatase domain-containing protein n=1 Tax=Macrolepiota fuliginosa MF-IS2 TaxID=1400762 RepID=A0A9P5XEL4_9AGAR|nr:hypothetical protein P691DRAFT_667167 [Macrolepiota fuliginosa MF-IS2]